MSKICQITGKKAMIGNNVSHSKRRTKRTFDLNLFNKKFYYVEQDCWISLSICANGLRIINKKGLDAALTEAVAKGYCDITRCSRHSTVFVFCTFQNHLHSVTFCFLCHCKFSPLRLADYFNAFPITTKNRKNTTERLELKKYNPILKRVTVHKEIK